MKTRFTWLQRAVILVLCVSVPAGLFGCGGGAGNGPSADPQADFPPIPEGAIYGLTGGVQPAGKMTWDEIVERDAQTPKEDISAAPPEGDDGAEQVAPDAGPDVNALRLPGDSGTDQPLVINLPGFVSIQGGTGPPDTMGAVGPNHIMTTLNQGVQVQTKDGVVVQGPVTLEAFFAALPNNMFDPRVLYSRIHGRWFVTANFDARAVTSGIGFAVSDTDDPTGSWTFYALDLPGTLNWADFVSMGYNKNWIVLTTDVLAIAGGFVGEEMWVIDASSALAGGALTVTQFNAPLDAGTPTSAGGRRIKPAVTYDPTIDTLYCSSTVYAPAAGVADGTQYIRLSQITPTPGGPVWSPVPDAGGPFPGSGLFLAPTNYSGGSSLFANAPQSGGPNTIDTGRALLSSEPQYRNGRLWLTHTGGLPAGGAENRTAIFWYQVDPSLLEVMASPVIQSGVVDGLGAGAGGEDIWYYYPSLGVNAQDDMCLGFSRSSTALFVDGVVTGRDGVDPLGTLDPIGVIAPGLASYSNLDGNGRNRWGDYSATCVDPVDDLTIWSIQEYAQTGNVWGTWWARHSVFAPLTLTSTQTYPTTAAGATAMQALNCSEPPSPPVVDAECTSNSGADLSVAFNASAPSGAAFDVELWIDGALVETKTAAQAVPGPSALADTFNFTRAVGGPYLIEVRADDGAGDIERCQILVTVEDTTAPTLVGCPLEGPIVECTSPDGAEVTFTPPTAMDVCDGPVDVVCMASGGPVESGDTFPVGDTLVTCTATDAAGNESEPCEIVVRVTDTTPPVVTAKARRSMLFLPRLGMIDVLLSQTAEDLCTELTSHTVAVYSNQANGSGDYTPDAELDGTKLSLRAETVIDDDAIPGRAYLVVVSAADTGWDAAGVATPNEASACTWVIVPKTATVADIVGARAIAVAAAADCPLPGEDPPAETDEEILVPSSLLPPEVD